VNLQPDRPVVVDVRRLNRSAEAVTRAQPLTSYHGLWRRIAREHDTGADLGEFTRLGLLTVPATLIVAVLALWASLHAIGG
jgi:hypothetical protein